MNAPSETSVADRPAPTREDVATLKREWARAPHWDIEETEGFEAYREELAAFSAEKHKEWAARRLERQRNPIGLHPMRQFTDAETGKPVWIRLSTIDTVKETGRSTYISWSAYGYAYVREPVETVLEWIGDADSLKNMTEAILVAGRRDDA